MILLVVFGERRVSVYGHKNIILTEEYAGGMIIIWGCFSANGTGVMAGVMYRDILEQNLISLTNRLNLGRRSSFQRDNNPKNTKTPCTAWTIS